MKTFLEPLTPDEEKIYIEKMRLGDKKAKDILIERNLRLVAHVVKKYYVGSIYFSCTADIIYKNISCIFQLL